MLVIRPIRLSDLDALIQMAHSAGAGFTSLPPLPEFLQRKIELSERSFARDVEQPGHERYMFVLEDIESGRVGGCCAIEAACGLDEPFYNYHVGITVHATRELGVYNPIPTLYLSNDYTGTAVLCSLYLLPEFRKRGGAGRLLSKCRFLFMANFPQRIAAKVIAEMRGVSDEHGRSPFWEGLGRHFFSIDYERAEHIVGMGDKAFIAELMPKHPIYTVLLSPEARAVIGQVHAQTQPALRLLEQEGFRYQNYIDIFDGGPTVEAPLSLIRSIARARLLQVRIGNADRNARCGADAVAAGTDDTRHDVNLALVANTKLADFRCLLSAAAVEDDRITLTAAAAAALEVEDGDPLRVSLLT
jgi:arginine N-succinyltransferase